MWSKQQCIREADAAVLVHHAPSRLGKQPLGYQYATVVCGGDNTPVEHPMERPRKGDVLAGGVRAVIAYWPDVCRLDLAASAAVDQFQARQPQQPQGRTSATVYL